MGKYFSFPVKSVDRVIDGDTVDVTLDLGFELFTTRRVRLYGINAPETRTKNLDEKERGKKSAAWLTERLAGGDQIEMWSAEYGKFGRALGVFYVDGKNINREMVELGLAVENYYGGRPAPVPDRLRDDV